MAIKEALQRGSQVAVKFGCSTSHFTGTLIGFTSNAVFIKVDILFQYTRTAIPVKSDFCRNKILHGEEVEYGSINNVIRAFLIIEFLDSIKTDDEVNEKITV